MNYFKMKILWNVERYIIAKKSLTHDSLKDREKTSENRLIKSTIKKAVKFMNLELDSEISF